jgi:nitroreductase
MAVFLADFEPHKRLPRIIELEKEGGMRTKQYMASLPIASTFLMGEGKVATLMKQVATHMMSPIKPVPSIDSVKLWSYKNTSLAAQTFVLAATSQGLATCFMEGYDDRRVKELLRIPDRYGVPLMCCIGYEYQDEDESSTSSNGAKKAPRLGLDEVFFGDTFGSELKLKSSPDEDGNH